jgi:cytochrome d ubiquinol oxidase subunit II
MGLLAFYGLIKSLKTHQEILPFLCSVILFLAGYFGLIASIYPNVVPPSITFHQAAAQHETLRFTLWGVIIVLPVVLGYTLYSYMVFRGKVGVEGYAH